MTIIEGEAVHPVGPTTFSHGDALFQRAAQTTQGALRNRAVAQNQTAGQTIASPSNSIFAAALLVPRASGFFHVDIASSVELGSAGDATMTVATQHVVSGMSVSGGAVIGGNVYLINSGTALTVTGGGGSATMFSQIIEAVAGGDSLAVAANWSGIASINSLNGFPIGNQVLIALEFSYADQNVTLENFSIGIFELP
jgi:hypothetical protein